MCGNRIIKDNMETVNYKYVKGQKLFYIKPKSTPTIKTCPTCEGEGFLVRAKTLIQVVCPLCKGNKTISNSGSIKYCVFTGEIQTVVIEIDDLIEIRYRMSCETDDENEYYILMEDELFEDIDEANKECEKMNNKCFMGYTT